MTTPHDDFLKHAHRVEARANALADDMGAVLRAVHGHIMGRLAVVSEKLKTDWNSAPLKRRKEILDRQRREVERVLAKVYGSKAPALLEDAAQDVMEATTIATIKTMNLATTMKVALGHGITEKVVTRWFETTTVDGLVINDWLSKLERAAADRIVSVGRQALVEGLGVQATARLMRNQGIEGSVPGLRGLASTFLQSAANHAREEAITEHFGEVVTGWQYTATLDRRTCLRCAPYDGEIFKRGQDKPSLPLHWRCRCLYLPVGDFITLEGGDRPAAKHSARTVHHRDGSTSTKYTVEEAKQVPASMTYQRWLSGQVKSDPAFVKEILGQKRFELFRDGKLALNQMVSHSRIKRLSELTA